MGPLSQLVLMERSRQNFMELIKKMYAHRAKCPHCNEGVVVMPRDPSTFTLIPDQCYCILCGKRYYMEIEDIAVWEYEQWQQKVEQNKD